MPTNAQLVLQLAKKHGVLRPRDLAPLSISRVTLSRLVRSGQLERVGRGLYSLPGADVTEFHSLVEAIRRVPHGVVCLLSALRFHDLTTQAPREVWIALDRRARKPRVDHPPLRVVRSGETALRSGVDTHRIEGVLVPITNPARTVSDCFRYRSKVGLDVAIEALRDYVRRCRSRRARDRDFTIDRLVEAARTVRAHNTIRPYLEALT